MKGFTVLDANFFIDSSETLGGKRTVVFLATSNDKRFRKIHFHLQPFTEAAQDLRGCREIRRIFHSNN